MKGKNEERERCARMAGFLATVLTLNHTQAKNVILAVFVITRKADMGTRLLKLVLM